MTPDETEKRKKVETIPPIRSFVGEYYGLYSDEITPEIVDRYSRLLQHLARITEEENRDDQ